MTNLQTVTTRPRDYNDTIGRRGLLTYVTHTTILLTVPRSQKLPHPGLLTTFRYRSYHATKESSLDMGLAVAIHSIIVL
jgi:hypothetical protein